MNKESFKSRPFQSNHILCSESDKAAAISRAITFRAVLTIESDSLSQKQYGIAVRKQQLLK